MSDYIGSSNSTGEKYMMIALGLVVVAFLVYVPFMYQDKQDRLKAAWEDKGCQMYDEDRLTDVPSKCHNDFVDHYEPQDRRHYDNYRIQH